MIKLQAKIGMPKQIYTTYIASQTITEIHWDLGGFDTVDRFSHELSIESNEFPMKFQVTSVVVVALVGMFFSGAWSH